MDTRNPSRYLRLWTEEKLRRYMSEAYHNKFPLIPRLLLEILHMELGSDKTIAGGIIREGERYLEVELPGIEDPQGRPFLAFVQETAAPGKEPDNPFSSRLKIFSHKPENALYIGPGLMTVSVIEREDRFSDRIEVVRSAELLTPPAHGVQLIDSPDNPDGVLWEVIALARQLVRGFEGKVVLPREDPPKK